MTSHHPRNVVSALLIAIVGSFFSAVAMAQGVLKVYGPGGPLPAMQEAATAFETAHKIKVDTVGGPTPKWIDQAKTDADLIFSGSETMMTDFVWAMEDRIVEQSITPLYLRPAAILVRRGNPVKLRGFTDLLKPGIKVLVVNGAGQNGLWEDIAGRKGDINTVRALRKNIVHYARNSADAKQVWADKKDIDAWLIWNIWQVANPDLAEVVPIEPEYRIYRDTGIALTQRGASNPAAKQYVQFLQSKEGAKIFSKWGWSTEK